MANPYMTRAGGATVTVFVPYDCRNHCPFCINKKEYADTTGFSVEAICRSIETMDAITPECDFVFTGGEPMAELEELQRMLDCVPTTHKVYINTTLPIAPGQTEEDIINFLKKNSGKITCLNVSRHMVKYVEESPDELLARLPVQVRINCVLYRNYPKAGLGEFMARFKQYGLPIQFRFDYTDTTPENLYEEENDMILRDLREAAEYVALDGCRMRCGFHFRRDGQHITYHKTLPYSTIPVTVDGTEYDVLYDIIVKQTGELHSDWDGKLLDVERYRNVVFEPYDLKWLYRKYEDIE